MRNIWILNHYGKSSSGRHYYFAHSLAKRGYNVTLFGASTFRKGRENRIKDKRRYISESANEIQFVFVRARDYKGNGKKRWLNMIDYALGMLKVSRQFDDACPDVIYASSVHPLTWLSGYFLSRRYGAKFVAETRDLWPETLVQMGRLKRDSIPARLLYWLEKFIYKKADRLIFTFPGGKDYVKGLGIDTSKVAYINNGVDVEEFNRNKESHIFQDLDFDDPHTFKVVYAGSMGQANALQYLVEAAEIIQSKGINQIKFFLFGDGYQRDLLRDYAEQNGLTNIVFKGRVEKKYIPSILSRADLNVFTGQHIPLYKYGLSLNKMFEYFASGVPTISNIECGYDLLKQYQCGVTVKGGSAESLADGILEFFHMPQEEYERFCKNAFLAAKDFDVPILTNKLEKVIKSITAKDFEVR